MTGEPSVPSEPEVLDGTLVEVAPGTAVAARSLSPVAVQAAAVAGAGFVAGAAAIAMLKGRRSRRLTLGRGRKGRRLDVVSTRTFLVDVHLVDRR